MAVLQRGEVRVRAEALGITRGQRVLFQNLSFEAEAGAHVAVRGANGAGKTSLLRAMAGFLPPSGGAISFDGAPDPALALHFLGHQNALKSAASVRSHVSYWAGLFGAPSNLDGVLDRLGIARTTDLPARVLSQGQARRLALARLLIAPRPVWLLDEPAAGLDASGRAMLDGLIGAHCAQGGIVFAAVHEPLGVAPTQTLTIAV